VAGAFERDPGAPSDGRPLEVRLADDWALKEAFAKAAGGGIGLALAARLGPESAGRRRRLVAPDGREFEACSVLRDGYVIALCVGAEPGERGA
jgi:hypothetical protein